MLLLFNIEPYKINIYLGGQIELDLGSSLDHESNPIFSKWSERIDVSDVIGYLIESPKKINERRKKRRYKLLKQSVEQ